MAAPLPPAGIIPVRHPSLVRLWLTREAGNAAFRQMNRLISALYRVAPGVLDDPDFLERSVLVDGVAPSTSPRDLQESFSVLAVEAAVLVRDSSTGYRVGLVVFADAAESASAINLTPRPGFYVACIPAASRHGDPRGYILDALDDDAERRRTTADPEPELLRSLVPPRYLLDDEDADLHLRCVFVVGVAVAAGTSGGEAYGLCRAARDHLVGAQYVCAAVAWRGGDAGVLVYDDADATELVARRAPSLLARTGLRMLDSSLLPPLLPYEADRDETSLLRLLLPPYIITQAAAQQEEYQVMLLRGLDTQRWQCDAAEIAYCLEHQVDLRHEVEAVVIHRAMGLVVVVLGGPEDAELLLQEPPETWLHASGMRWDDDDDEMRWGLSPYCLVMTWLHVSRFLTPPPDDDDASHSHPQQQLSFNTRDWTGPVAYDKVMNWLTDKLGPKGYDMKRGDEAREIVYRLVALCALANPGTVWSSSFPDRSLLLSGIPLDTAYSDLVSRVSTFGALDDLVYDQLRGIAVAVFRSWYGAARLGRKTADDWNSLAFTHCRRVPYAGYTHAIVADIVVYELARCRSSYGPFP